ncbi:hypothetical protein [Lacticaseibacillus sp. 866-1]|uniref:hypothetical protein n=1 Tax=Lacticaseibacillus sp. 866-1 TaxID=2799576 RepID=UPI0019423770|nr:hypothetical protein [Lacticaseibacillus sp. 866-1]
MLDGPRILNRHELALADQLRAKAGELEALGFALRDDALVQGHIVIDHGNETAWLAFDELKPMLKLHDRQLSAWLVSRMLPPGTVF